MDIFNAKVDLILLSGLANGLPIPKKIEKNFAEFDSDPDKVAEYSEATVKKYGFEGSKVHFGFDTKPKTQDVATSQIDFEVKSSINAGKLGEFNASPLFSTCHIYSGIKSNQLRNALSSNFGCKSGHFEENHTINHLKT